MRARSIVFLIAVVIAAGAHVQSAAAATCATTATAAVCLTNPLAGASLFGTPKVTVSVSSSGTATVSNVFFFQDGTYLLTAYRAPFSWSWPTTHWKDGPHTLQVGAQMTDGSVIPWSPPLSVTFSNGLLSNAVNTSHRHPVLGRTPLPGTPFVVAAVGDGADGSAEEAQVGTLIKGWNPNLFLYLGDVYNGGSYTEFYNWYRPIADFGSLRNITNPTVGNHEYGNGDHGYDFYWSNLPHWYSVTTNGVHLISLDANQFAMTAAQWTAQLAWLDQDLAAHAGTCIVAYWHQPLFHIDNRDNLQTQAFWTRLYSAHAKLVLNGHDHSYSRWQPMNAAGAVVAGGITEIVDGTGGAWVQPANSSDPRVMKQATGIFGATKLTVTPGTIQFAFTQTNGTVVDSGSVACP